MLHVVLAVLVVVVQVVQVHARVLGVNRVKPLLKILVLVGFHGFGVLSPCAASAEAGSFPLVYCRHDATFHLCMLASFFERRRKRRCCV